MIYNRAVAFPGRAPETTKEIDLYFDERSTQGQTRVHATRPVSPMLKLAMSFCTIAVGTLCLAANVFLIVQNQAFNNSFAIAKVYLAAKRHIALDSLPANLSGAQRVDF